jgi:hypothetical protein
VATNRPTIDSQGYKSREGLIIEAVWSWESARTGRDSSSAEAVWNMTSSRAVRQGRYSGVVYASLGQMKNQKKLLVHVV